MVTATGRSIAPSVPLAERRRPHTLDEVVGQEHLLGPGKPLRVAFEMRRELFTLEQHYSSSSRSGFFGLMMDSRRMI